MSVMQHFWQRLALGLGAVVILAACLTAIQSRPANATAADDKAPPSAGRYTVVETQATNLIVVDNQTNTLYYYTAEKDAQPGEDLKLRGTADLNHVGKPVIKLVPAKKP
jgi:curli biogenesis system outer membrane secretion channel CsgG